MGLTITLDNTGSMQTLACYEGCMVAIPKDGGSGLMTEMPDDAVTHVLIWTGRRKGWRRVLDALVKRGGKPWLFLEGIKAKLLEEGGDGQAEH